MSIIQKKQAAVIDVGSSIITALVGEQGINKTFIVKAKYSYQYEGFSDGIFFEEDNVKDILVEIAAKISQVMHGNDFTVYVGVPSAFTSLTVKNSQISFPKKKKIDEKDIDSLFDAAFVISSRNSTLINRSAIVYELDDCRMLANPLGCTSEILKGKLSFIDCNEYFINKVVSVLKNCGIQSIECVSSSLARALYLLDAETRDRIAVILDVGYITTTFSVVQGDGILYEKTFDYGGGYITAALSEKFALSFNLAEDLKRKVNICSLSSAEYVEVEDGKTFSSEEIKNNVLLSLDSLCEKIADAFDEFGFSLPEYVPLYITGGGIAYIRGAKEHLSSRTGMPVYVLTANIPMMDKPTESTVLSLLNIALEQN